MNGIDKIARDNGFLKTGEMTTSNIEPEAGQLFGMDIVQSDIMPKGWVGLRTDKGVMCIGPKGTLWVPAFDPSDLLKKTFSFKEAE